MWGQQPGSERCICQNIFELPFFEQTTRYGVLTNWSLGVVYCAGMLLCASKCAQRLFRLFSTELPLPLSMVRFVVCDGLNGALCVRGHSAVSEMAGIFLVC